MFDELDPPNEDGLNSAVAAALTAVLSRHEPDEAPAEVLRLLRGQLKQVLTEAPTLQDPVKEIAMRARLARIFEAEIQRQESKLSRAGEESPLGEVTDFEEKRRWPRRRVHLSAQVSTGGSALDCVVLDLSDGGAQVEFAHPAPISAQVTLMIRNRGTYSARCRWTSGARAGLEFIKAA
ncbi:PilZ domain-containing protein [Muricoccus vinaceus]|uniref:PilZ domain-containing protein n=1 Tax=Muricoccus vinaceus TaxID=424704 RepID=A0ABV6ILN0_9PROT